MTVPSDAELLELMQALALKYGCHMPKESAIAVARAIVDRVIIPEESEFYPPK